MAQRRCYSTLEGGTSWFDFDEADHWEGRNQSTSSRNDGWGTHLCRTPEGKWIEWKWRLGEGAIAPGPGRLPFWEIGIEAAAHWFTSNRLPEPDALFRDLDGLRLEAAMNQSDHAQTASVSPLPSATRSGTPCAYAEIEGGYSTFRPDMAEFYWRGTPDRSADPPVRPDLFRHLGRWIVGFFTEAGEWSVPLITERGSVAAAFFEVEIEMAVRWFNDHARPLPLVLRQDLEWWKCHGLAAREYVSRREPPDPPRPAPPPPGPNTINRPLFGPYIPAALREAHPGAIWVCRGSGPVLPVYADFPPEESDPPPRISLGPLPARNGARPVSPLGKLVRFFALLWKPAKMLTESTEADGSEARAVGEGPPPTSLLAESAASIPSAGVVQRSESEAGSADFDGEVEQHAPTPDEPEDTPDLVTLDQAAAMVKRSKRTLERFKTEGKFPDPVVEGGGGRADLFDWRVVGPWLTEEYGIRLPSKYPRLPNHKR